MQRLQKLLIVGPGPAWPEQKAKYAAEAIDAVSIDLLPAFAPDIVRDILRGLPFDSNSFDRVEAHHILEHISGLAPMYPVDNYDFVIQELHRVTKPGGVVDIRVPYWKDDHAVEAAGHIRFFNENSWVNYYTNPHGAAMGQVQFSSVVYCALEDTNRAHGKPAREVHITLMK